MKKIILFCFLTIAFATVAQDKRGTIKVVKPKDTVNQNPILIIPNEITDTIKINNATFKIVLPKEYKSKWMPKILNGGFVLVDEKGKISDNGITSCVFSLMIKGRVTEYYSHNSLYVPMIYAVSNNKNLIGNQMIISSLEGTTPGGVTLKNIIPYFYLERIR